MTVSLCRLLLILAFLCCRPGTVDAFSRSSTVPSETVSAISAPSVVNPTPSGASQWTHDAVGKRLTQSITLPGIPQQVFSYDANDRLVSDIYDANGNTLVAMAGNLSVSHPSAPLTGTDVYDSRDILAVRLSADGAYVSVLYNGDGHRVQHQVFRPAAGSEPASLVTTRYLVDDLNPTGYAQVVEESTITSLSGAPNVRALTNPAGEITDTYDYDAWGQLLHTTGATTNPYLYNGEQYDPALGLYHLRARMMNPLTGRFWNADTYEGTQDPASLHKYLYAGADPVQNVDPSGNVALLDSLIILGNKAILRGYALVQIGFSASRGAGMAAQGALGRVIEMWVGRILVRLGATIAPYAVTGPGGNRVIDFFARVGERVAAIEVKSQIPTKAGPALPRLVAQLQSSISTLAGRGQTVLFTFREPSVQQMTRVEQLVGSAPGEIKFVNGLSGLVNWFNLYFSK